MKSRLLRVITVPLLAAAFAATPDGAPADPVLDRDALKLPPPEEAIRGVYAMRTADLSAKEYHGTLVLQSTNLPGIYPEEEQTTGVLSAPRF